MRACEREKNALFYYYLWHRKANMSQICAEFTIFTVVFIRHAAADVRVPKWRGGGEKKLKTETYKLPSGEDLKHLPSL